MKIKDIDFTLNNLFPYSEADVWDNVGLLKKKFKNINVDKVILSLDISLEVINLAIKKNIKLIISHHPIWIDKSDKKDSYIKKMLSKLQKHKISIISLHTNYDKNKNGMNYQLSKILGFNYSRKAFKNSYGNIASIKNPISEKELISKLRNNLNIDFFIHDKEIIKKNYKHIYICGGAGSSEIENLIKINKKIDCYISGEIKWHIWKNSHDLNIKLFDIGHNIENIFVDHIEKELKKINITSIKFSKIKLSTN